MDWKIPEYQNDEDPIKQVKLGHIVEWTQSNKLAKQWEKECRKLENELKELRKMQKLKRKCKSEHTEEKVVKTEEIKEENNWEFKDTKPNGSAEQCSDNGNKHIEDLKPVNLKNEIDESLDEPLLKVSKDDTK